MYIYIYIYRDIDIDRYCFFVLFTPLQLQGFSVNVAVISIQTHFQTPVIITIFIYNNFIAYQSR